MKAADGFAACNVLQYGLVVCIAFGVVCEKDRQKGEAVGLTSTTSFMMR
jgi:hypothetical protein